jgi:hypothetical protein
LFISESKKRKAEGCVIQPKQIFVSVFFVRVERGRRRGAASCSANNWYQSEKIPEACGDSGEMPLKPTAPAAYSMRGGGRREVKLVGGVIPLVVGSAMPLGGDGGVMLPREVDGTTLLQGDDGHDGPTLL